MPYIDDEARKQLHYQEYEDPWDVGTLTYCLYRLVVKYLNTSEMRYADHAEVIAALDNAKEEYRRRFLNPYEDQKREENGDV